MASPPKGKRRSGRYDLNAILTDFVERYEQPRDVIAAVIADGFLAQPELPVWLRQFDAGTPVGRPPQRLVLSDPERAQWLANWRKRNTGDTSVRTPHGIFVLRETAHAIVQAAGYSERTLFDFPRLIDDEPPAGLPPEAVQAIDGALQDAGIRLSADQRAGLLDELAAAVADYLAGATRDDLPDTETARSVLKAIKRNGEELYYVLSRLLDSDETPIGLRLEIDWRAEQSGLQLHSLATNLCALAQIAEAITERLNERGAGRPFENAPRQLAAAVVFALRRAGAPVSGTAGGLTYRVLSTTLQLARRRQGRKQTGATGSAVADLLQRALDAEAAD